MTLLTVWPVIQTEYKSRRTGSWQHAAGRQTKVCASMNMQLHQIKNNQID